MRLFLTVMLASTLALADCSELQIACDHLIQEQDLSIQNLKKDKRSLEDAVVKAEDEGQVMKYFYLGLGVLTGFGVGYLTTRNH